MPGAGFKRLPPGTREALRKMRYAPYEYVRKQMVSTFMSVPGELVTLTVYCSGRWGRGRMLRLKDARVDKLRERASCHRHCGIHVCE